MNEDDGGDEGSGSSGRKVMRSTSKWRLAYVNENRRIKYVESITHNYSSIAPVGLLKTINRQVFSSMLTMIYLR